MTSKPSARSFVGEPPAGDANPDDFMSNDQQGGVSEDTGTTDDRAGEPESTPHDEEENPATLRSHEDIRAANPHPRQDDDA